MKIQKLLLCFLAAGALFVGCGPKEEPQPSTPMLNVSPSDVKFEQGGGSVAVSVTSNRPWSIETDADWLNFSPANGQASDAAVSVNVSALANSGNDRTASFKVKTEFDFRTITVTQPGAKGEDTTDKPSGDGSKDNPYNPAGVVAYISTLAADTESPNVVYVTGKISEVGTTYEASGTYGNATFYMSEDGSKSLTQFYVYQTYYLGNKKWKSGQTDVKVGDVVTVCGKVTNYKGNTPETVGKGASYVCTLNDKTEYGEGGGDKPEAKGKGTLDDPYNPSAAADAVANLTWTANDDYQTTDVVYVKGKISKIADKGTYTEGGNYGNASFYIVEDGTEFEFYVFRALYLGNKKFQSGQTDIKVGDEVIICGKLMNYRGNTPETVSGGAYLYSLNGETDGGGGSSSDYENAASKTVAEFISAADANTYFKLTGTVSNFNSKYCSFDLTDDSGTIYVYSVSNKDEWSSKITDGGTVTLAGKYAYYEAKEQHEVVDAYILSFEGGAGGNTEEVKTVTVAEFLAAEKSTTQPYKLTGTVSNIKNTTYGNFDLTDETGTVYIYGLVSKDLGGYAKNKANDKSFESIGIKEGDKITIVTFRDDYTNSSSGETTIEGVGGYYVSGASGGGDDTPAENATVAQALAADKDAVLNVGPALVVAAASTGFLIEQDGSMIYVYGGTAAVGDMVTVKATRAEYSGTPQLSSPTVTVKSSDNKVTYPSTAKDINSSFDTYTSTSREFVTFKGKLSISNDKYFNVTVDGASSVTGSLVKPVEDISSYNGKEVTLKGYYLYHASQGKYLYIIATEINGTALTGKTSGGGSGEQGGGEVSGNTVVFSSLNIENGKQYNGSGDDKTIVKASDFTVFFGKGSNDGKYYNTGTGIRTYGDGYIRIESAKTITKIVYTFQKSTSNDRPTYPSGTDYTLDTGSLSINEAVATWTGSAKTVKLTRPSGTGHWRLQKVEVTFAE